MVAFATVEDVRARWATFPSDDGVITTLLEDATVWLRSWFPSIPDSPGENLAGALRMVSVSMVKRALLSQETSHLQSQSYTAGPFAESRSFRNSEGNLYLTGQEQQMLENALAIEGGGNSGMMCVEARF
ncbi:MAG: hypothetical protein SPK00_07725 [Corynebacterium glucuronolyticum]|nr:hypothetical protein [Corynebacterium glucuronolyticum]MDD7587200.1 hypothetical protein [Mycobacteriaceae bacterium]MDY5834620.1 hypothetical protein [Corynebacterium glucuronolyticum]